MFVRHFCETNHIRSQIWPQCQSEKGHVGILSVQEKVISELRHVQERVDHDARAEVALEYCIKMISSNQLNE